MPFQEIPDKEGAWTTDDPEFYHFLVNHDPPRPGVFLKCLKADLRTWRIWLLWGAGLLPIAAGITGVFVGFTQGWLWLGIPAAIFTLFVVKPSAVLISTRISAFRAMVRRIRHYPVLRGVIHCLGKHYDLHDCYTADVELPDGRTVPVWVNTALGSAFFKEDVSAEVLFLAAQEGMNGIVICIRRQVEHHVREATDQHFR